MFHIPSSSESHQFANAQRVAELVSTHGGELQAQSSVPPLHV